MIDWLATGPAFLIAIKVFGVALGVIISQFILGSLIGSFLARSNGDRNVT